jgi:hypothetical protein
MDNPKRDENSVIASMYLDPNDPEKGIVERKPPVLNITPKGDFEGKERAQPRFNTIGDVFLRCADRKAIRAKLRDVSLSGIGINIEKKIKGYRVGERFMIEFAQPHRLQNLYLQIELARVTKDESGKSQVGFRILTDTHRSKKKLTSFINYLKSLDPFWV